MFRSLFLIALAVSAFFVANINAQHIGDLERKRGEMMLEDTVAEIKRRYFDQALRGIDLDTKVAEAKARIKTANSNSQIMGIIAAVVMSLDDSHTMFFPPARADKVEYGWLFKIVGDKALVYAVKPKSDAEAKGLRPGDQIIAIDNVNVLRSNLWVFKYLYYDLQPRPVMSLKVVSPGSSGPRDIEVRSRVTSTNRVVGDDALGIDTYGEIRDYERDSWLRRHQFADFGKELYIWKMPQFDVEDSKLDVIIDRFDKFSSVILDLRGNHGGLVRMYNRLIGAFFENDVKISEWKGRKEYEPQIAKGRRSKHYGGKLFVLIDSESASAAELFAKVIQLEKRGVVIGDVSSGRVMVSRVYPKIVGADRVIQFGVNITEADMIMNDGKSIEKIGVIPDLLMLPDPSDFAAGKDPVLAYAASLAGVKIDPVEAGRLFPVEWRR